MISSGHSWDSICTEVGKCTVLCANCHRELHAGLHKNDKLPHTIVPTDLVNYRKRKCPQCGGHIALSTRKHCSYTCVDKNRQRKVDWPNIDLPGLKATYSNVAIGKMLGG